MNYSDFFKMIPEASLVAILIVLFVADFATAKAEERKWFNPLASILLLLNTFVCLYPMDTQHLFGDMYVTSSAVNVMKAILSMGTFIVVVQSRTWAAKTGKEAEFYMAHRFNIAWYVCDDECRQFRNVLPWARNGVCTIGMCRCF